MAHCKLRLSSPALAIGLAVALLAAGCGGMDDELGWNRHSAADPDTLPAVLSSLDGARTYQLKVIVAFEATNPAKPGEPKRYWLDFHGLAQTHQTAEGSVKADVQACWLRWRSKSLGGDLVSRKTFDLRESSGARRFPSFPLAARLHVEDSRYLLSSTQPTAFLAGAKLTDPLDESLELPSLKPGTPWQSYNPDISDEDRDGKPGLTGKGRIYLLAGFEIQGAVWGLVRSLEGQVAVNQASADTGGRGAEVRGSIDLGGGLKAYGGSATGVDDIPSWIETNILKYDVKHSAALVMRPLQSPPQRCQDLQDFN